MPSRPTTLGGFEGFRAAADHMVAEMNGAVWPRGTKFERRCYELLREAYVKARYSRHCWISDEQLDWLSSRVELLQKVVREVCEERIATLVQAA